jgi:hypothetical protein
MFQPASTVPCARIWHTPAFGAFPGGVAVRRAPEPGPSRGDRGVPSVLFIRPLAVPPWDKGVRHPQLPSSGSRIVGFSLSCYQVIQVDAHAPFDKGWLVVRRLIHESAYAGVLGKARSRLLGTKGAEALPRWDPSASCPRWLLNTTCGAPSSWRSRGQARMRAPWSSLTLSIWGACSNPSRVRLRIPDQ